MQTSWVLKQAGDSWRILIGVCCVKPGPESLVAAVPSPGAFHLSGLVPKMRRLQGTLLVWKTCFQGDNQWRHGGAARHWLEFTWSKREEQQREICSASTNVWIQLSLEIIFKTRIKEENPKVLTISEVNCKKDCNVMLLTSFYLPNLHQNESLTETNKGNLFKFIDETEKKTNKSKRTL